MCSRVLKNVLVWVSVVALVLVAIITIFRKYNVEIENAKVQYVHDEHAASLRLADHLSSTFAQIYQGARTIARLPSVRGIDRFGKNFQGDGRKTVQEIYNNLAGNVDVSELYIVDKDLDADKIDARTGKAYEPITTFDELIVGRHAKMEQDSEDEEHEHEKSPIPEVEIFEYRLMKRQIAQFQKEYPTEDSVKGLVYPALMGPEVVTCDNRYLDPKNIINADRSGIVYSLPFFGPEGKFRGIVSAVFLTRALTKELPSGDFALVAPQHGYQAFDGGGEAERFKDSLPSGYTPSSSVYAEQIKLEVPDSSEWNLWVAKPQAEFWKRGDVQSAKLFRLTATLFAICVGALALMLYHTSRQKQARLETSNQDLEEQVRQRTTDLIAARKLEAIGQMSAGVAHEINTPAQFINDNLRFLEKGAVRLEQWHEKLQVAKQNYPELTALVEDKAIARFIQEAPSSITESLEGTDRINEIVRAMRDYAHPSSEPTTVSNLNTIIENTLIIARNTVKKSATVETHLHPSLPTAYCNPGEIGQAILNLVVNAAHAIQESGRADGVIRVESMHSEDWIYIKVSDNGTGIPEENLARIFDQFFTTKDLGVGTGMGLSIVKHVAEKQGGCVKVRSKVGVGTTFEIQLPKSTTVAEEALAK